MDLQLTGKSVLITGASKGIGACTAEVFAEEGSHLLLAARSGGALDQLASRLRAAHGVDVAVHPVDLRRPDDMRREALAAGLDRDNIVPGVVKRRPREVSPELKEFMHMLKTIEDQAEAAGLPDEE